MRRVFPVTLAVALCAFVAGWLLGSTRPAGAAPASTWEPAVEEWYLQTGPSFFAYRLAVEGFLGVLGLDADLADSYIADARRAAGDLEGIEPPVPMLAVQEQIRYAVNYCDNMMRLFEGVPADDAANPLGFGILVPIRDHCLRSIHEARIERARYAAEHGPFPELPTVTPAPTPRATPTAKP